LETRFADSFVIGRVVGLTNKFAVVDAGLKIEGRVALKEFGPPVPPPRSSRVPSLRRSVRGAGF